MRELLNLTSHDLDLVDAKPATISADMVNDVEKKIKLPVFMTLNGKFVDKDEEIDGVHFMKREFVLNDEEIDKLINKLKDVKENELILIVSLPVLLNAKNRIENRVKAVLEKDVIVAGIIQATERGVYPPIACLNYFAV